MDVGLLLKKAEKKASLMTSFFKRVEKDDLPYNAGAFETKPADAATAAFAKAKRHSLHEMAQIKAVNHKQLMKKKAEKKSSPILNKISPAKKPRMQWTKERKTYILKCIAHFRNEIKVAGGGNVGVAKILAYLKTLDASIYSVDQSMVSRWVRQAHKSLRKVGKKVNPKFETAVISKLFVTQLTKSGDLEILANAAFSYDCFRHAANIVRQQPEFKDCPIVKKLQFTHRWVHGIKKRYELRKRRCTTIMKTKPTAETIEDFYRDFHETVEREEIKPDCIFNEDETAIFCCPELLHQYINNTAHRAVSPFGGEEGRFTALLGSSSNGRMLPVMMILKVGTGDKLDLTNERTLAKVKAELNLHDWERFVHEVTITDSKGTFLYRGKGELLLFFLPRTLQACPASTSGLSCATQRP